MARNKLQVIVVTIQGKEMSKRENKNKGKKKTQTSHEFWVNWQIKRTM